jgi:hypothetical protein
MARRWTVRLAACSVALPLLLAGCSQKQQASQSVPTTSKAAAPSSSLPALGPADFPLPAAARQKTPDGVEAFANYYVQLLDRSGKALDSTAVRTLSRNCATCTKLAAQWDQAKAAGQRIDGGSVTLISTGSVLIKDAGAEIPTYIQQAALSYLDPSGTPVPNKTSPAVRLTGGIKLEWDGSRSTWVVTQFDADPV